MKNSYEVRGGVTAIFLRRKDGTIIETLIDTVDLEKADSFPATWNACWDPAAKSFYVRGCYPLTDGKRRTVSLHRWLFDEPSDQVIDHRNHETLDNRKTVNLRSVSYSNNAQNRNGLDAHNKSGIRGVSWSKAANKWRAQIKVNNKCKHIGVFDSVEEAEIAMKNAQIKYHPYALTK